MHGATVGGRGELFIVSHNWTEHKTDLQAGGEEVSWNETAQER